MAVKFHDDPQANANATLGYLNGWLRAQLVLGKPTTTKDVMFLFDQINSACVGLNPEYAYLTP